MSKPRRIVILGAIGIFLAVIVFFVIRTALPREPSYQGRSLSSWVGDFSVDENSISNAEIAMRIMDTNAIPFLLKTLAYQESPTHEKIRNLLRGHPVLSRVFDPHPYRAVEAAQAISAIGTAAESAFSPLTNLFYSARPTAAGIALAGLGEEGTSFLVSNLTNQNAAICKVSALSLGSARSNFETVVPALINAMTNNNSMARTMATMSLGTLHKKPEIAVPALITNLDDPDALFRSYVILALGEFGTNAKASVPLLIKARKDTNTTIQFRAEKALEKISPESLGELKPK